MMNKKMIKTGPAAPTNAMDRCRWRWRPSTLRFGRRRRSHSHGDGKMQSVHTIDPDVAIPKTWNSCRHGRLRGERRPERAEETVSKHDGRSDRRNEDSGTDVGETELRGVGIEDSQIDERTWGILVPDPVGKLVEELHKLPGTRPKVASGWRTTSYAWGRALRAPSPMRFSPSAKDSCAPTRANITENDPCRLCQVLKPRPHKDLRGGGAVDVPALNHGGLRLSIHRLARGDFAHERIRPEDLQDSFLLKRLRGSEVTRWFSRRNPNLRERPHLDDCTVYLSLGIRVTRPAAALPVGGDLEYADEVTLGRRLEGRRNSDIRNPSKAYRLWGFPSESGTNSCRPKTYNTRTRVKHMRLGEGTGSLRSTRRIGERCGRLSRGPPHEEPQGRVPAGPHPCPASR